MSSLLHRASINHKQISKRRTNLAWWKYKNYLTINSNRDNKRMKSKKKTKSKWNKNSQEMKREETIKEKENSWETKSKRGNNKRIVLGSQKIANRWMSSIMFSCWIIIQTDVQIYFQVCLFIKICACKCSRSNFNISFLIIPTLS